MQDSRCLPEVQVVTTQVQGADGTPRTKPLAGGGGLECLRAASWLQGPSLQKSLPEAVLQTFTKVRIFMLVECSRNEGCPSPWQEHS